MQERAVASLDAVLAEAPSAIAVHVGGTIGSISAWRLQPTFSTWVVEARTRGPQGAALLLVELGVGLAAFVVGRILASM